MLNPPALLRNLPQWVLWRYVGEDRRKVPWDAQRNRTAKSNDPATWSAYDVAAAALDEKSAGLGFVFRAGGGIFGVDLDGCIGPDATVKPWAVEIINRLGTYAEVSPSGTGVKLWGMGQMPDGKGLKRAVPADPCCDREPAVEAYDRGRYFTFTGRAIHDQPRDVVECQAGLDWLVATHLRPPAQPSTALVATSRPLHASVEERAAKYLDHIEPAVSGSAGHNQTFRAACSLVLGFALPVDRAFTLLKVWNERCQPPWSDRDLWHKLGDADSRAGERGYLLNGDGGFYSGPDVDISFLCGERATQRPDEPSAQTFPAECLRVGGILGEIMRYNQASSIYWQPELALAGAICLMATITGRKVCDPIGNRTNIYAIGLAPSGAGKDHARKINKDLLIHSGAENMVAPESIGSSAGLIAYLSEHPAALFQLDEIARLLLTMQQPGKSPHLYNIGTKFLQLYSSASQVYIGDAYAEQKNIKRILCPHPVIYGTAVPSKFWGALDEDNVTEGLVGRFIVFESASGYGVAPGRPTENRPSAELLERVRWWIDYVPNKGTGNLAGTITQARTVEHDTDAAERLHDHMVAIASRRSDEPEDRAAIWSRSGEKAAKLALLSACSRADGEPTTITLEDVDWGIRLANYLTRNTIRRAFEHISGSAYEAMLKRARRVIGDRTTMSDWTRKMQRIPPRMRDDLLRDLLGCGEYAIQDVKTAGRSRSMIVRSFTASALNDGERRG